MNDINGIKVCFEIGLNHLGDYKNIDEILELVQTYNFACSLTLQIREEEFYDKDKNFLRLKNEDYLKFQDMCGDLKIPFGLAFGPLKDFTWIKNLGIEPNFIKLLAIATNNIRFVDSLIQNFECDKYFSVALSELNFIEEMIVPRMSNNDSFIHTSLSHLPEDQNLSYIRKLNNFDKDVYFGQHCSNPEICFAAIGSGAKKIFAYIGNKELNLPDYDHCIGLSDAKKFYDRCIASFSAMNSTNQLKKSKINFIG